MSVNGNRRARSRSKTPARWAVGQNAFPSVPSESRIAARPLAHHERPLTPGGGDPPEEDESVRVEGVRSHRQR